MVKNRLLSPRLYKPSRLACALIGGSMLAVPGARAGIFSSIAPSAPPPLQLKVQTAAAPDFVPLVKAVKPAVVSVTAKLKEREADEEGGDGPQGRQMPGGLPFGFPFPFMMPGPQGQQARSVPVEARGSGFLIGSDGYIVTNNHVVADAVRVSVKLDDGIVLPARIVGRDAKTDLALLKVSSPRPLPYLDLGNSEEVQPGQWIVAVGDPFGLGGTVTAGIVSALGRDLHSGAYNDFIQLDAPINRGNSGGPLLTLNGKVVGVNSMILSPNGGGSIGIGFAIPSDTVRSVVEQLRRNGHVTRGYLGILSQNLTPALAQALGIKSAPGAPPQGALVAQIMPGGPAAKSGLKVSDVILTLDGKPVRNGHDLAVKVTTIAPGAKAVLGVLRDGKPVQVEFTVGNMANRPQDGVGEPAEPGKLGVSLMGLNAHVRRELGLEDSVQGAAVAEVRPDSPAARAGVMSGDVITAVGRQPAPNPRAVAALANRALAEKKPVLLRILRDGQQLFIAVSMDAGVNDDDPND